MTDRSCPLADADLLAAGIRTVLAVRPLASFDGLGHLVEQALPDDAPRLERLALSSALPARTFALLRASALDPLALPPAARARLAALTGLAADALDRLVAIDAARFATVRDVDGVRSVSDAVNG